MPAVEYAHARYISRKGGGSATRSAAYNSRDRIVDERTGQTHKFVPVKGMAPSHKQYRELPVHHAVLLPDGAPAAYQKPSVLWNAAEAAEKRINSQVAREVLIALPADSEVTRDDWIEMATTFAKEHFVSKGLAVQIDIHAEKEHNPHCHVLITTRRVDANGFGAKARDLHPEVRNLRGKTRVTEAEAWGETWREYQNAYFRERGYALRVDPISPVTRTRLRTRDQGEIDAHVAEARKRNEEAARDPAKVLETITLRSATFTQRDVDRLLTKHLPDARERREVRRQVMRHPDLLELTDRETGQAAGRYTTRQVREQEERTIASAATLARRQTTSRRREVSPAGLRPDQRRAFEHIMAAGGFAIVEGRSGTGKSHLLGEIRKAYEAQGLRVVGMAPTNVAAQNLRGDGFADANTAHSHLFRMKSGMVQPWDNRTVVVVDEAAMLSSEMLGSVLAEARSAQARVILAGDDRQLSSIERSGLFRELVNQHGSAELTEVIRQRIDWQKQASQDMAEGAWHKAVQAFEEHGAIDWRETHEQARAALVATWAADARANPETVRHAVAFTNSDVDWINAEVHTLRRYRGELGEEFLVTTAHGKAEMAIGDRIVFTGNDKKRDIANGATGTIRAVDGEEITVGGDDGKVRQFDAGEFDQWRLAYATTIHKSQSATRDAVYVLHSKHVGAEAAYVALSRQRDSVKLFVGRDVASDTEALTRQMARGREGAASIAYGIRDDLADLAPWMRKMLEDGRQRMAEEERTRPQRRNRDQGMER